MASSYELIVPRVHCDNLSDLAPEANAGMALMGHYVRLFAVRSRWPCQRATSRTHSIHETQIAVINGAAGSSWVEAPTALFR
jgi:hypothetical protein